MKRAAIWVDACIGAARFDLWSPGAPLPGSLAGLATAGVEAAPAVLTWTVDNDVEEIVLLTRDADAKRARLVANVLTGGRPEVKVVVMPTAAGGMPALMAAGNLLGQPIPFVTAIAQLRASLDGLTSGVWLTSVARLGSIAVPFRLYLRSLFPRRLGFLALFGPERRVSETPLPAVSPPGSAGLLVVAADDGNVPPLLSETFADLRRWVVPPVVPVRAAYGSQGVEFVVVRPLNWLSTATGESCPVCREALYTPACPVCHVLPRVRARRSVP